MALNLTFPDLSNVELTDLYAENNNFVGCKAVLWSRIVLKIIRAIEVMRLARIVNGGVLAAGDADLWSSYLKNYVESHMILQDAFGDGLEAVVNAVILKQLGSSR